MDRPEEQSNPHGYPLTKAAFCCEDCPVDIALEICDIDVHNWLLYELFATDPIHDEYLQKWVAAKEYWERKRDDNR